MWPLPLPLLTALLAAAVAGGGAWTYQGARWGKQVAQMELAQSQAALRDAERAFRQFQDMEVKKDVAIKHGEVRRAALARDVAAATGAVERVRGAAAEAVRDAGASHAACLDRAAALSAVFGKCVGRYRELGSRTQGHTGDVETLMEAWPVVPAVD